MEDVGERDRRNRELCDAVIELLGFAEARTETHLTHAFFVSTIRESRLAHVTLESVARRGQTVYPVWMIQSRKSAAFLMMKEATRMVQVDDIGALVRRAREHSPRLESCAFLLKDDFERFVQKALKVVQLSKESNKVSPSPTLRSVHGWIYPDRPFTIIRFARQAISVAPLEAEAPHGQSQTGS